jgi:hypothetical protein
MSALGLVNFFIQSLVDGGKCLPAGNYFRVYQETEQEHSIKTRKCAK